MMNAIFLYFHQALKTRPLRTWRPPLHYLRHSYASRALALGEGLPMIAKLLGHAHVETTARYAHLARDSVRETAERIAVSIAADIRA